MLYLCKYMFVSLMRACTVYVVNEVTSSWGARSINELTRKRTRAPTTDYRVSTNQQEECKLLMLLYIVDKQCKDDAGIFNEYNKLLSFKHEVVII